MIQAKRIVWVKAKSKEASVAGAREGGGRVTVSPRSENSQAIALSL